MFHYLFHCVVIMTAVYCEDCKHGWETYKDSCYFLSKDKRDWETSKLFCELKGSYLVEADDKPEEEFLLKMLSNLTSHMIWIGARHNLHDKYSTLLKGSEIRDSRRESNSGCNSLINRKREAKWLTRVVECSQTFFQICEKNQSLIHSSIVNPLSIQRKYGASSPSQCTGGWFTIDDFKYFVSTKPRSWIDSKMLCESIGTRLVTIGTDAEYHIIKGIHRCVTSFWIGSPNTYRSKTGSIISFSASHLVPETHAQCIIMKHGWAVANCNDKYASICEEKKIKILLDESAELCQRKELQNCISSAVVATKNCDCGRKDKKYVQSNVSIIELMNQVNNGSFNPVTILNQLKNATSASKQNNEEMSPERIMMIVKILTKLAGTDSIDLNSSSDGMFKSFLDIVSNLLGDHTTNSWIYIIEETGRGAIDILDGIEQFMTGRLNETDDIVESTNDTYTVKASIRNCENGFQFPNYSDHTLPDWIAKTQNKIFITCDKDSNASSYIGIILSNAKTFPSTFGPEMDLQYELNTAVISFSLIPKPKRKLKTPLEITFQTLNKDLDHPRCVYWKNINRSQGYWSDEGCWLHHYKKEDGVVVCKCNHLTQFTVLMSLATNQISDYHLEVLSIITQTGLIISMVFLVLNVVVYILFWRYVKSAQSIIKVHLSCVLFLANLLFVTGIDKTADKVVCTVIAVFLHLLYLMVFFVMLSLGVDMLNGVLNPIHVGEHTGRNIFASYATAFVVVAVSMVVVKFEGYGTENYCWLSADTGLIWAFLLPVLITITINLTIVAVVLKIMFTTVAMTRKSAYSRVKSGIRGFIVLLPVMGLTWIFGSFTFDTNTLVFHYLFSIFNSLQGLCIFILHCVMNEKMRKALQKMRTSCIQTTISKTQTSDAPDDALNDIEQRKSVDE